MHLWNDYEGTTLAGQWTLGRLLRTEGRSALFSTTKSDGSPAVLRLTEALNDQAVLHARYRAIQAAGDQYLVAVEGFGDAEIDGAPLSYAVLEPTQESLSDIVAQRRLDPEEVHEVGKAVAGGLAALHAQGLVHGLVEPDSVLAAGDRIKLRSDCARPAPSPEDAELEGAITAKTDALGLAGVLYRALTQGRLHDASDALALPEPFATIVRNTARGTWGVPEIQAELARGPRAATVVPAAVPVAPVPAPVTPVGKPIAEKPVVAAPETPLSSRAATQAKETEPASWSQPEDAPVARRRGLLIAGGFLLLMVLLYLVFHKSDKAVSTHASEPSTSITAPAPAMRAGAPAFAPSTKSPEKPHAAVSAAGVAASAPEAAAGTTQLPAGEKVWRVVAYTYNRRNEADAKAASLNQRFPGFNASAWSRTGQRPFLVTLGGEMSRQQAFVLRAKARHAGVAPDVYAQNYAR